MCHLVPCGLVLPHVQRIVSLADLLGSIPKCCVVQLVIIIIIVTQHGVPSVTRSEQGAAGILR